MELHMRVSGSWDQTGNTVWDSNRAGRIAKGFLDL